MYRSNKLIHCSAIHPFFTALCLPQNWQIMKGKMADVLYSMELWKASLKAIEGNFGTGVTSYFLFLKWLFLFNIPTFLIIFFFVIIPQLLWQQDNNSSFYTASDASFTGVELLTGGVSTHRHVVC